MYWFIPDWYDGAHTWHLTQAPWFQAPPPAVDDTLSDLHMFLAQDPSQAGLLTLSHAPQLRRRLFRHALAVDAGWNVFDEAQGLAAGGAHLCSAPLRVPTEPQLPQEAVFYYTPLGKVALLCGALYAAFTYGEEGNLLSVRYFFPGEERQEWYDDRGFVSCRLRFAAGKPQLWEYLDAAGAVQFRVDEPGGQVSICLSAQGRFARRSYQSLSALVRELLLKKMRSLPKEDCLVLAVHEQHNQLVLETKGRRQLVLTAREGADLLAHTFAQQLAAQASLLVTETPADTARLREGAERLPQGLPPVLERLPLDVPFRPAKSRTMAEKRLFLPVEDMEEDWRKEVLRALADLLAAHPDWQLVLGAARQETEIELREELAALTGKLPGGTEALAAPPAEAAENESAPQEDLPIAVVPYFRRQDASALLAKVSLILDLRPAPDAWLQMAGLCAGIPLLVRAASPYAQPGKNARLVTAPGELPTACAWYLESLAHANEVYMWCAARAAHFRSGAVVRRWQQLLEGGKER